MKYLFFIAIFFSSIVHAQRVGNSFINPKVLVPDSLNSFAQATGEPSIVPFRDSVFVYFTAMSGTGTNNVTGLRIAKTMAGSWTTLSTPVVGKGYGGAPSDRQANCNYTFVYNDSVYMIATNGYGVDVSEDREVYLYKSGDGRNFTSVGKVLLKSQIAGCSGYGNVAILPTLVNGYYEILAEAFVSGIWQMYRFRTTDIASGWTFVSSVPSLQPVSGAMYGGPNMHYVNGKSYVFFHYGTTSPGNLPTNLAFAFSSDFSTYTLLETPFKGIEVPVFGSCTDQLADACVEQIGNKTYLAGTFNCNTPTDGSFIHAEVWYWEYNGTISDLLFGNDLKFYGNMKQ